jgi:hypothetical protein
MAQHGPTGENGRLGIAVAVFPAKLPKSRELF